MADGQDFFNQLESLIKDSSTDKSLSAADILAQWGCPSASIAIMEDGKITSHCISSVGNDTETLFQACSISKPTAGLALMKLIEQGVLSLDDKICNRLPENVVQHLLSDPSTAPIVRTITLKHLMSHTSGMSQGGFPGYPDTTRMPTTSEIITGGPLVNTMPVKLITLPGLEFMYSGGGCVLFQLIMERATNKPFVDIITELVLKPLNMTRSYYYLPPTESNVSNVYYNGHLRNEVPNHTLVEQAAAGLWTTPTDLLKLTLATQDSLNPPSDPTITPFMPQPLARQMLTLVKHYMGLTWFANDTQFGHSGGNAPGYCCYLYGYADMPWNKDRHPKNAGVIDIGPSRCGVSVMTNSGLGLKSGTKIMHAINYLKGWPQHHELDMIGIGIPCPAPKSASADRSLSDSWRQFLDTPWSDVWTLVEMEDGTPGAKLTDSGIVHRLVPAAIPSKKYEDGRESTDLLFEGLRLGIRLCWDGEERIVEFVNDGRESRTVLKGEKEGGKKG